MHDLCLTLPNSSSRIWYLINLERKTGQPAYRKTWLLVQLDSLCFCLWSLDWWSVLLVLQLDNIKFSELKGFCGAYLLIKVITVIEVIYYCGDKILGSVSSGHFLPLANYVQNQITKNKTKQKTIKLFFYLPTFLPYYNLEQTLVHLSVKGHIKILSKISNFLHFWFSLIEIYIFIYGVLKTQFSIWYNSLLTSWVLMKSLGNHHAQILTRILLFKHLGQLPKLFSFWISWHGIKILIVLDWFL